MAAGKPLGGAEVTLFAGSREGVSELGQARTDTSGSFGISYVKPAAGMLYVQAGPAGASRLRLQSVVGVGSGGGVRPQTLTTVTIDELTTVATAYALALFSGPNGIAGPSPGLEKPDPRHARHAGQPRLALPGWAIPSVRGTAAAHRAAGRHCRGEHGAGGPQPGPEPVAVAGRALRPGAYGVGVPARAHRAPHRLDPGAPVYRHRPLRIWPHRDRRQGKPLVKQQLAAGDQESQPLRDRAQPGGPAGPGQSDQRRRHEGRSLGGRDRPGRLVLGGQLRRRRDVAVLGRRRSAVTQHGVDERRPQPPAGRRRRPEGQRVDRQQLRSAERTRPRQRRGLPGGDPSKAFTISGSGLNHPFAVQIDGYGRAWVTNAAWAAPGS